MNQGPIRAMFAAEDEPGMVDVIIRVPVAEVLGHSLTDLNSEGGLYGWSGWFEDQAKGVSQSD